MAKTVCNPYRWLSRVGTLKHTHIYILKAGGYVKGFTLLLVRRRSNSRHMREREREWEREKFKCTHNMTITLSGGYIPKSKQKQIPRRLLTRWRRCVFESTALTLLSWAKRRIRIFRHFGTPVSTVFTTNVYSVARIKYFYIVHAHEHSLTSAIRGTWEGYLGVLGTPGVEISIPEFRLCSIVGWPYVPFFDIASRRPDKL